MKTSAFSCLWSKVVMFFAACACAGSASAELRIGLIGLDTYHSVAFTKYLNGTPAKPEFAGCRVTVAYKWGSKDIPSAVSFYPKNIETVKGLGVEFVDSIDELLQKCDAVLLETNDGREHLAQAEKVFKAGKRVFIDKPLAHDLADSMKIVELARKYQATFFTSSAIRYVKAIRDAKAKGYRIRGMDCWTCFNYEPTHDKWYWYGIHAVDPLFAVLGRGCEEVVSLSGADGEVAIGRWKDGRFGVARGLTTAKPGAPYGGVIFTEDAKVDLNGKSVVDGQLDMGTYEGYADELREIINYFRTGVVPVESEESLEVMAFMTAARRSSELGRPVKLAEVLNPLKAQ